MEFVGVTATDGARVGFYGTIIESKSVKNGGVGFVHSPVSLFERVLVFVK